MKRMMFTLVALLVADLVCAQPQAPITWGETRWLPTPALEQDDYVSSIWAHGDTLVAVAYYEHGQGSERQGHPELAFSTDNGITFGTWHVLYGPDSAGSWSTDCQIAFTSDAILCLAYDPFTSPSFTTYGFWRTTDLGQTWQWPVYTAAFMRYYDKHDDTLFCATWHDSVTWTCDGGRTFAPRRCAGFAPQSIYDLAVSSQRVHAISWTATGDTSRQIVRYVRGPLLTGTFDPVEVINPNIGWTDYAAIALGDDGTGMLFSCDEYHPPAPDCGDIVLNITRDNGATWSPADTLWSHQSALYYWLDIWHWHHWWLACWIDTVRDPGFAHDGLRCVFSPNDGRFWYPSQQIEGIGGYQALGICGELRPFWARIGMAYWDRMVQPRTFHFAQWEGQIRADSLLPTISPTDLPADTVTVGDSSVFSATAADNDTVFEARLDIRSNEDSSWTVVMNRAQTDTFLASWRVPREGRYRYRLVAEDLWENTSSYPDTGWATFITEGWIDAVNDSRTLLPESFAVTIYPNPANGWPRIELSPEWFSHSPVMINVFNLLGQKLMAKVVSSPGSSGLMFTGTPESGSGIYFLRVANRQRASMHKFVILK